MNGFCRRLALSMVLAFSCVQAHAAALSASRTSFPGSVRAVPSSLVGAGKGAVVTRTVLTAGERAATMPFEVGLRMRNFDEMQARIARGERLSDAEKVARYFPTAADHDRVVQWLKAQGLEVTRTDDNHLGIFGRGSVDAVAVAFQVSFARVAMGTEELTSAVTAPSLPSDISPIVLGIHGLQPHIRRHPISTLRTLRPDTTVNVTGYLPAQIQAAYGASGLTETGAGQTIAVYGLAYPTNADLTQFWTAAGVTTQSVGNVTTINVAGGPAASPTADALEEAALDAEWATALAPGVKLRIYGANEFDPAENDEILQQVYADLPSQPTMHIFSISVGGNELEVPKDYLFIEAQYLANLASAGVTVLVASGDSGASANGSVQTTYPTSDPDVTGVGGTTLTLGAANAVMSETGWAGSGGGISVAFSRPSWQTGTGVPSGSMRLVPDVASAGDPNEGAYVVYQGNPTRIGGTSWGAPTWAAFCALINQQRGAPIGLINPWLYPQNGTSSFRDITQGNNGTYNCGIGYDLVTGLGTPNLAALIAAAAGPAVGVNIPGQLGNRTVTLGQPATFYVVGEGTPPLSYAWQRMASGSTSWAALADGGAYAGTKTQMLVVGPTTHAMSGDQFRCIVSNTSGSATGAASSLTVNNVGVTTMAGWPGSGGSVNATGWAARLNVPGGVRVDPAGNIYVADSENYQVRKVSPAGVVTTVAGIAGTSGSTDGPVATALFSGIGGVAFDSSGDVYVADSGNYTIRKVSGGVVSTLAGLAGTRGDTDGTGSAARLYDPQNLAVDSAGNIYVADGMGNVVRKITPAGVVTTIAGSGASGSADGTGTAAQFNNPTGIAVDALGNVYVADNGNDEIRIVTPAGAVTTLAGHAGTAGSTDGTGSAASFSAPAGLCVDSSGNVYVADSGNSTIRKVTPSGFVTTVAGLAGATENIDGLSSNARFDTPGDITIDSSGVAYVADALNDTIRRLVPGADSAPIFTAQPADQTINLGSAAVISVGISGTAPLSFQWYLNNSPIPGATSPSYVIAQAQSSDAGDYTLTVTNVDGSATSSAATLTLLVPADYPDLTAQPQGTTLVGGTASLSVTVTGPGPFTYQWLLNGSAIAGATASTYTATAPGSYTVAVSNAVATVVSSAAFVSSGSRLINLSSRAQVETGAGITIAGFVIEGPPGVAKQVLIRGVGPTLSQFGVTGVLAAPVLMLIDSNSNTLATNTGWGTNSNAAEIATITGQVGAFALPSGSADSVLLGNLTPGAYTAQLTGAGATTGVALVEVYETDTSDSLLLHNISTRAQVGTGGNILIAGFVVQGTQPATVLIRAVGPGLSAFGVAGVLSKPVLTVFDSTNTSIASNTGWQTGPDPANVATVGSTVGAFSLSASNADSALVLTLQPGSYTAQVTGAGGTTGIALVEVYQAP
jgi:sugar lactone lactonase YvrE